MRRATLACIVRAALVLSGCGGSKQSSGASATSTTSKPHQLTPLDLINIMGPEPDTPAGAAYAVDPTSLALTLSDLRQRAQTTAETATVSAFERAGFKRIYQRSFRGAVNLADGTAYLFGDATGGAKGFAVLKQKLERPGGVSQRVTPLSVQGLGDETWAAT